MNDKMKLSPRTAAWWRNSEDAITIDPATGKFSIASELICNEFWEIHDVIMRPPRKIFKEIGEWRFKNYLRGQ